MDRWNQSAVNVLSFDAKILQHFCRIVLPAQPMLPRLCRAIVIAAASVLLARGLPAATISGTVTDADLRTPLASMIVAAYSAAGTLVSTATTDSLGHYSVGVPSGSYRALAYDEAGTFATSFGNDADSFETSPLVTVTGTLSGINF